MVYVTQKAPTVLGREPAGVVQAVSVGDRVFVHRHAPCLASAEWRRGLWSNCVPWRSRRLDPGGFAEYVRVPAPNVEREALVLPEGMEWETAVFIEPLATGIRAVRRWERLEAGDAVLIVGLGAMGLLMAQLVRVYGAGVVSRERFPGRSA